MRKTPIFKPLFDSFSILILLVSTSVLSGDYEKTRTESAGNDIQHLILAAGLGASIFYEEGNEGTYQFFKSFIASQLFVFELKNQVNKTRPNGKCCNSFPSGHASASFVGAAFIHNRYGWEYAVPAYVLASYVSYSRVYADKHYLEDVVVGAAIGLASGFYFTDEYKKINVIPVITDKQVGIYFSMTFD